MSSPDNRISVSIDVGEKILYAISYGGELLLEDNYLRLTLVNEVLGMNPELQSTKSQTVNETINPVVPLKFSSVANHYNSLILEFGKNFDVEFRVFNDGVAYRFTTDRRGDAEVTSEDFVVNFPNNYLLHLQQTPSFKTFYEHSYSHLESGEFNSESSMSTLPVLIDTRKGQKILISESDLTDYPAMFLK